MGRKLSGVSKPIIARVRSYVEPSQTHTDPVFGPYFEILIARGKSREEAQREARAHLSRPEKQGSNFYKHYLTGDATPRTIPSLLRMKRA